MFKTDSLSKQIKRMARAQYKAQHPVKHALKQGAAYAIIGALAVGGIAAAIMRNR